MTEQHRQRINEQIALEAEREKAGVRFVASYRGEAEYTYKGRAICARTFACNYAVGGNFYTAQGWTEKQAEIGCVYFRYYADADNFPPAEIMRFFPGFVRLRRRSGTPPEYDGPRPAVVTFLGTPHAETDARHAHDLWHHEPASQCTFCDEEARKD